MTRQNGSQNGKPHANQTKEILAKEDVKKATQPTNRQNTPQ